MMDFWVNNVSLDHEQYSLLESETYPLEVCESIITRLLSPLLSTRESANRLLIENGIPFLMRSHEP